MSCFCYNFPFPVLTPKGSGDAAAAGTALRVSAPFVARIPVPAPPSSGFWERR